MLIGLFGDVHGRFDIFYDMLSSLVENERIDAAFQVGDFGLSAETLKHPELFSLSIPLYIVDGNHEDFRFLKNAQQKGLTNKWSSHNLHYQLRGSLINIDGISTGFIGGALNVDRPQQRKSGNVITNDDIINALRNFSLDPPDMIISHSCPSGIGIGMRGQPSHIWGVANYIIMAGYNPGPSGDYGEEQLTDLWDRMPKRPGLWVFGHFHQFQFCKIGITQFLCLPRIDLYRQCVILDTATGEFRLKT